MADYYGAESAKDERQELRQKVQSQAVEIESLSERLERKQISLNEKEDELLKAEQDIARMQGEITGYINAIKIIGGVRDVD